MGLRQLVLAAGLRLGLGAPGGVQRGLQELALAGVQPVGVPLGQLVGLVQAGAAVEQVGRGGGVESIRSRRLPGGPARPPAPLLGALGELAVQAQVFAVGVQPLLEGRPLADQGLVGHLGPIQVGAHQAGGGQHLQHGLHIRLLLGVGGQLVQAGAAAGVLHALAQLGQAQEDAPGDGLGGRRQPAVHVLGGAGDGLAHPTGGGVAAQGQGAPLAALPGLQQGVGEQRQRPLLLAHLVQDQVHQPGLELPGAAAAGAGRLGRRLDGLAQLVRRHGSDVGLVGLQRLAQPVVLGAAVVEIGPQGDQDAQRGGALLGGGRQQRVDEGAPLGRVFAQGEALLELVDHQQQVRVGTAQQPAGIQVQAARVFGQVVDQGGGGGDRFRLARQAGGQAVQRVSGGGEHVHRAG